jgi:hypothetical protein
MSGIGTVRAYQTIVRIAHNQGMRVVGLTGRKLFGILAAEVLKRKREGRNTDKLLYADLVVARKAMQLKLREATGRDLVVVHPEHLKALEGMMGIPNNKTRYIGGWLELPDYKETLERIRKYRAEERKKRVIERAKIRQRALKRK